ncbi:MAG: GNAT family N-acetyltransferase [Desulfobacula sp.]|uniref:bifunctional acetate--CoA ligase family protein/GNAT family N-acetyltransferase n=1 Tax=Desulfobacula sp. TaxID=2593537 RepID=UPI0025BB3A48|nr:bifunctional acetyl coenzyme A synthetase (ADP forming), alpha domain/GNAT family N-acetyltransferase [Desulfobacula sp.]MCD4721988.1 GNAT family N-acetyltransferase [Desulfobacula sp.]
MSTFNLHRLFNPKSVAVVGASEKKGSIGFSIMRNLLKNGFRGDIFPVNPKHSSIMGLSSFAGIKDIGSSVDVAIIAIPIHLVPGIVDSCGKARLAGVVIISSGGREAGEKGRAIEARILEKAQKYNLRIIGPNCLGFINISKALNASFAHLFPLSGNIAFLSQSGAVCTSVIDLANRKKIGFSHFVSLGSMMDVDFADMIDYLGSLSSVKIIVLYIENITNIRNFMSAARSVSRVKPIIALKSGRSKSGARVAVSHTNALVGVDAVYDAAFQRAGILRVNEFEELLDCSAFLAKLGRPSGPGLTMISNAAGPGVMAADALESHGMEPAILNPETIGKLDKILPENWSRANPIDIVGDTAPKIYADVVKICVNAPETDALLLMCSPVGTMDTLNLANSLIPYLKTLSCPVFTAWIGGDNVQEARHAFNQVGIVTYDSAERAVRAFKNLYQYGRNIDTLLEIPVRTDKKLIINRSKAQNIIKKAIADGARSLTKIQARNLLLSYGICPKITKIADSEDIAMQVPADYELIIGSKTDPNFGPVIFFGMGGVLAEVFKDTSMGLPPLNRLLARQMIEDTKISKVLKGFKNFKQVSIPLLEELLIRTGRLVTDFPEIIELDINPLVVKNGNITAVDARVSISVPRMSSPDHLIISSYPWQYEKKQHTINGHEFFIRPIRPTDADLMINHFDSLSPRSVYMRFFSPVKQLSKTMLIKLTQIDYDREIALVALMGKGRDKKIIGVCRIILEPDKTLGEFALAISDEWQGKGIGSSLLKLCLKAAQTKGIQKIMGIVFAENTQMLMLGRKLGFSVKRHPESGEYDLIIDFKDIHID